jgi:hypothetical protein
MESDLRYYSRRAAEEALAAQRAITEEARARREFLAAQFLSRVRELRSMSTAA